MPSSPSRYAASASTPGILIAVAALLIAALYRQPYWPAAWLDEGFVTNGAMTLATRHVYGTTDASGVRVVHPTLVANGPGVVVPTAVAMSIGGVGLEAARAMAALFMVVCGLLAMRLAAELGGPLAALTTLAILLALPREGFAYLGRMAMGNVPALAYVFGGFWIWWRALETASTSRALVAGALFGLAAATKAQWSMVLPPALVVAWLIHTQVLRRPDTRLFVAAAAGVVLPVAAWYAARAMMQGLPAFTQDLAELRETARWNVLALAPWRDTPGSAWYLLRSGIALVVGSGLAYATWHFHRRSEQAVRIALPAAIAAMWMMWYLVVSIGWPRYAFEGFAVSALLAGPAFVQARDRRGVATDWQGAVRHWLGAGLAGALVLLVVVQGVRRVGDLLMPPDTASRTFAGEVQRLVGPDERIESWEWQLDVLIRRQIHHPDDIWVGRYTARIFAGEPVRQAYNWRDLAPDYLVDGPFSKFTGVYQHELDAGCCALVTSAGGYDLYRVVANPSDGR